MAVNYICPFLQLIFTVVLLWHPTLLTVPMKVCHTVCGVVSWYQCYFWNKMSGGPIKQKHLAGSISPETNQPKKQYQGVDVCEKYNYSIQCQWCQLWVA